GLANRIDVDDADADVQIDLVARVPLARMNDDVVGGFLAGQHRREHHPVVVDVRLVAEHDDLVLRAVLDDLLDAGHPGHPVAHDDEPGHRASPPAACATLAFSTRAADCL